MNQHRGKIIRRCGIALAIAVLAVIGYRMRNHQSPPVRSADQTVSAEPGQSTAANDDLMLQRGLRLKSQDASAALSVLKRIPATSVHYAEARKNIAHIMLVAGKDAAAAEILDSLLENHPNDSAMHLATAELWYRLEEWKRVLPRIQAAIVLAPDRADSHILLAETLDELGRIHEMTAPLQKAISLDSDSWSAHILLVYAALSTGDLEVADEALQWCADRRENDALVLRYRSMLLRARGEHDAALVEVRRAIEIDPQDVDCRLIAADILLYNRQPQEAYDILKPVYEACRSQRTYLGTLARAAALAGLRTEAQACQAQLQKLIQEADDSF